LPLRVWLFCSAAGAGGIRQIAEVADLTIYIDYDDPDVLGDGFAHLCSPFTGAAAKA